jgi:hypothetical protein
MALAGELQLPGLSAVVLPKAMTRPRVLAPGSAVGACVGPKCADGGLHFSMKPIQWEAPPPVAMPAPGQMPTADAVQPTARQLSMPSLKWQSGPVTWRNEDLVFGASHAQHGNGPAAVRAPGEGGRSAAASPPRAVSLAHQEHSAGGRPGQHAAVPDVIEMGNIAPQPAAKPAPQSASADSSAKQRSVLHKLAAAKAAQAADAGWLDSVQASVGHAAKVTSDTAVRAKDDVTSAGVRVEHRVNPYDAPPAPGETAYEYGLEVALVVCLLLLLGILVWFIYKNFCQDAADPYGEPRKAVLRRLPCLAERMHGLLPRADSMPR